MAKLLLTISDVRRIIFLIHKKSAILLKKNSLNHDDPKQIEVNLQLGWTESELKRYHNDDIDNIERILMQGYNENEITNMFRYHLNKAKRKFFRNNF